MSRSRWLPAGLALALAVLVALLLWLRDAMPAPAPPRPPAASSDPAAPAAIAGSSPAAPDSTEPAGAHAERTAAVVAADAPSFTVEVRDARTHTPVAEADVFVVAEPYEFTVPDLLAPLYRAPVADAAALHARTDARGRCDLRVPAGQRGRLWAAADERYGERTVVSFDFHPGAVLLLEIDRDPTLRVRVVDPLGRACDGVPVALGLRYQRNGQPIDYRVLAGATDADGMLELRHLQQFFAASLLQGASGIEALACLADPGLHTVAAPFVWQAPPREPLVLSMPPTGALAVTMPAALGPVQFRVQLRQLQPEAKLFNFWATPPRGGAVLEFPRAAVGAVFEAQAVVGTLLLASDPGGPTRAGERAELRLKVADGALLVRGRLLQRGEPAATQRVRFVLRGDGLGFELDGKVLPGNTHGGTLTTAADGTFVVPLARRWAGKRVDELRLQVLDRPPLSPARAVLPGVVLPDRDALDVGDVALEQPQPIVRGRVRTADGTPCDDYWFRAACVDAGGANVSPDGLDCARDGEHFALFAGAPIARGTLTFRSDGWLPEPVEFAAGDAPKIVTLARGGEVLVTVRTPGAWPDYNVDAQLVAADGGSAPQLFGRADEDGARIRLFHAEVRPGRYDLRIGFVAQPASVVHIDGIEVPAGGRAIDARLVDVQLAGRVVRVDCIDAATQAPIRMREHGRLLLDRPPTGRWRGVDFRGKPAELVVAGAPEALALMPGYRPTLVTLDRDDVVVRMEKIGAELTLRLPRPELPLPAGLVVRLVVAPELDADEARMYSTPAMVGRVGDVVGRSARDQVLAFDAPTTMRVTIGRWNVTLTAAVGDRREPLAVAPAALALQRSETVELGVDAAEWQRALRALQ